MNDFAFEIVSEPETDVEEISLVNQLADQAIEANKILKEWPLCRSQVMSPIDVDWEKEKIGVQPTTSRL